MKISIQAIDNPLHTTLFAIVILVIGIMAFTILPVELFPDVSPPIIFVTVEYQGASPTEIEFQINKKLEEEFKSLDDVKKITSIATQGFGNTIVEFVSGSDSDDKRTKVKEAVDNVIPDLPDDIETPIIKKLDFAKAPIMNIVIYGKNFDYVKLKDIAKDAKEIFETIPRVAGVNIFGGLDREISVYVDPVALRANNVSLSEVVNFFTRGNLDTPGGKIPVGDRDYYIRVLAKFIDAHDVNQTVIKYRNGKPIYLKDLGKIVGGTAEITSFARYNGLPAISLALTKQDDGNILDISEEVYRKIEEIKASGLVPEGLEVDIIGDQSDEVRIRVKELTNNAVQGIGVVFLVLLLSMGFRNALIASLGIPFCIVFTMVGLLIFDESINNISQFGLIIVIGIVVDGAIVVLENTYRHVEMGKDPVTAAKVGVEEVGGAVISSGLTTMAAFAPMLFMTGIVGEFMGVIPKTVIIALFGSLVFDHVIIPVLCSKFLKVKKDEKKESFFIRQLKKIKWMDKILHKPIFENLFKGYSGLLRWSVKNRLIVVVITTFIFFGGIALLQTLKSEFFPEMDIGKLWVQIELPSGTKVEKTDKVARQIESYIIKNLRTKDNPNGYVEKMSTSVGSSGVQTMGAEAAGGTNSGPNIGRIDIDMVDAQERTISVDQYISDLRKICLENVAGAKVKVKKPQSGPPVGKPVNVVVYGDNLKVLKRISKKIQAVVEKIPGAIEVEDNYGLGRSEIQAQIDRRKVEKLGSNVQEIQYLILALFNGIEVSKYQYGQDEYEIRLKILESFKKRIEDFEKVAFYSNTQQRYLPITEVVNINIEEGLSVIVREDLKRSITIGGEVDRSRFTTAELSQAVVEELKDYQLPPGYFLRFRGENEDRDESFEGLKLSFIVGVMLIYFIVVMQLNSFIQPMSIMISVLLSVVGIAVGLFISGKNLGIMAFFGAVALAGIVVNDAIVLVSYINLLRDRGMPMKQAVIEAGETRLRPIFLTTFTTIGGLLPLALALGGGARDFWSPMGWTIIGGLFVATFQTLVVVPITYSIFEDWKELFSTRKNILSDTISAVFNMVKKIVRKRGK